MQERGGGRYVFELWLGGAPPPKLSGCTPTPIGSAEGFTVEVTKN